MQIILNVGGKSKKRIVLFVSGLSNDIILQNQYDKVLLSKPSAIKEKSWIPSDNCLY
jgi:hypothetical protein